MKLTTKWTLTTTAAVFPLILLCLAGFAWLWENQAVLTWIGIAGVTSLICTLAIRRMRSVDAAPTPLQISPSDKWNLKEKAAWERIETLSADIQQQEAQYGDPDALWDILTTVMRAVSEHFYPDRPDAVWEIRVPELLRVTELLSKDLRLAFSQNIPGSHILTISDVMYGQRMVEKAKWLYDLYRVVSFGADPISAAVREIKSAAFDSMFQSSSRDVKLWLLNAYVKKIGYYAIELYGGHITPDDDQLNAYISSQTADNLKQEEKRNKIIADEPLRILVAGQVNAGKSSLINALFGEIKAATDVVPETSFVQSYLLERDGVERAIILDTAGYDESRNSSRTLADLKREVRACDLIILVCSAVSAARDADRKILDQLRREFLDHLQDEPPLIIALSHIDQLRPFREWNPPYNIAEPDGLKAQMIRSAMQAAADDLNADISGIVPVNLKHGQEYNVEEGLIPAILSVLNDSLRMKYLRCSKQYRDKEYWRNLWIQAKHTGRIIIKKGAAFDKLRQRWLS